LVVFFLFRLKFVALSLTPSLFFQGVLIVFFFPQSMKDSGSFGRFSIRLTPLSSFHTSFEKSFGAFPPPFCPPPPGTRIGPSSLPALSSFGLVACRVVLKMVDRFETFCLFYLHTTFFFPLFFFLSGPPQLPWLQFRARPLLFLVNPSAPVIQDSLGS